jgi:lysyl-tRNA synthetase class 2
MNSPFSETINFYPMNRFRQSSIEQNLRLRAQIIWAIRSFFVDNDYLEVETPCRIPAPAPEFHIDAQASVNWFLQTSPELYMKRLLASGYPRIFQICKCFRQNERGNKHLPELTMLEWYTAGKDYRDMMNQCEDLICFVARHTGFKDTIIYQEKRIDLIKPWTRLSVSDAFDRFGSIPMEQAILEGKFDEVIASEIEPHLGQKKPLFLYDYPASTGSLARLKPNNSLLAERFELYIGGIELCNAFTELTDSDEQRKRFEKELSLRKRSGKQVYPIPEIFLDSLKFMPDASGNALGIDRLVMLFADTTRIDDVVAFTPEEL